MRANSLDVLRRYGCTTTACGLVLPERLVLDDWAAVGRALAEMDNKLRWVIGDWWAYGEHRYGDRHALIESDDWKGPSFQTCMNAASVCRTFETSRRREVLSFKHHAEVAGLPDADALLDWAEETISQTGKPRSTRELRDEVDRRRRIKQMSPRSFGAAEPMTIDLRIAPAPEPEAEDFFFIRAAAAPRHEPEVEQQLGDEVSQEDREAKAVVIAGIHAALRKPVTAALREQLQQCLRILAPS